MIDQLNAEGQSTSVASPRTVLVVDDEPSICWAFQRLLGEEGHRVLVASSAEEGLQLARASQPALVLLDVRLPHLDGIAALPQFHLALGGAPVVVMTAFGDLETAVAAIDNGAADYLTKPFHLEDALSVCRKALRSSPHPVASAAGKIDSSESQKLIGRSPSMQQVFRQIALLAGSDLSVLITGETGTGKELVAAAIVQHSQRRSQPYLAVAPVALNADLIESELFGHVKGAFTGATEDRAGLFEQAEGGSVLLDEIGDLPMAAQVKLLRVLEQGDYFRVGDTRPRRCNVRILAATNCDLRQRVAAGAFREDLYYRLNGSTIHLSPLRQRPEDVLLLCQYFLRRIDYPSADTAVDEALAGQLSQLPWPGNVRQLRNAVEHAALIARGRGLVIDDFPSQSPPGSPSLDSTPHEALVRATKEYVCRLLSQAGASTAGLHTNLLAVVEPVLLETVLNETQGNRIKAAELLGMHRGTLRERLRHYRLDE